MVAAGGYGLYWLRNYVHSQPPYTEQMARVSLDGRPDFLTAEIPDHVVSELQKVCDGRSIYDADLAQDVYNRAIELGWVKCVHRVIKTHDGTVLVQAEFRRPFAFAVSEKASQRVLVDDEGCVLPMPPQRLQPGQYITVFGVATAAPAAGKKWNAPDLIDGIKLLKLIKDRSYASEITGIDVRNFAGRISNFESHIRLHAQLGQGSPTQVLFGRFPADDGLDYCLTPDEMLANLDAVVASQGGRLSGVHRMIDVRYDKPHVR